jgi:hypothetical protein
MWKIDEVPITPLDTAAPKSRAGGSTVQSLEAVN